ncbi:MAG: hypothetical protein WEA80_01745 [Gemmatimonadaceae bacterium]
METYETGRPWVTYTYPYSDRNWRLWLLGRTAVDVECLICGERERLSLKIPRFGPIVDRGPHPLRTHFLAAHRHRLQATAPETWKLPLRNIAALGRGDLQGLMTDVANRARSLATNEITVEASDV